MGDPFVTIIIVTHDALHLLKRCLPSVVNTDYPNFEIIIADNASTDGTAEWLDETYPSVHRVSHPENWLFAKGNNAALPAARGEYVLFLNNDVIVPPEWLRPLVRVLQDDPKVAAVQPKLIQTGEEKVFEYAGAGGGFIDRLGYPFARGRIFDAVEEDHGQYDVAADVFWATGAAMLLRREAFEAAGMFDERFGLHMEEIDLCWRLHELGYRVRVEPESEVRHLGGSSLPSTSPLKTYYNFRNSLLMLYKHTPRRRWPALLTERAVFDTAALLRYIVLGQFENALSVVNGYSDAHRMKSAYSDMRPSESEAVPPPYKGWIALDYFVSGRSRFSELPPENFRTAYQGLTRGIAGER